MDGSLFRVVHAQLKFGTLLHKSALRPYPSNQTVCHYDMDFCGNISWTLLFIVKNHVKKNAVTPEVIEN